jgi:NADH:ubiquinone oxidoreductase subunit 3 (subunit A)
MLYNYIAGTIIVALSLAVPFSLALSAKLVGSGKKPNQIKNSTYESGEMTIGRNPNTDFEYLPYFAIFLPMEFVSVAFLLYTTINGAPTGLGEGLISLLIASAVISAVLYLTIGDRDE